MSNISGNIDLSSRSALVTGASRGIGKALALALAGAGAHVIAVARTTGALEELDDEIKSIGGSATLMPLDLRDFDKIDMIGPALAEKFKHLDIFIGNAGMIGTMSPLAHSDAKEWQTVMDVNVNANYRLIRTLDPLLRASQAGRVIFTGSSTFNSPKAYWGSYRISKATLNMLALTYAAETENTNMRVNIVHPGPVKTALLDKAYPGGYHEADLLTPEDWVPLYLQLCSEHCKDHGELFEVADLKKAA